MQKTPKLLLLAVITLGVLLGVLFIAYQSITKTESLSFLSAQEGKQMENSGNTPAKTSSKSGYVFSHPSNGSLAKTQSISITHNQDDTATGTLDNNIITPKLGQDVILYSAANETMAFAGKISNVEQGDTHTTVTIDIPKEIKDVLNIDKLSNKAEIIIFLTISSQRYPYSALQKDKNGNHFVWAIEQSKDNKNGKENKTKDEKASNTHTINKIWLDKPTLGLKHFSAGRPINAFSLVILNPDDKLKDGESYKASEVVFKAPIYAGHKQARKEYKQQLRVLEQKRRQEELEKCRNQGSQNKMQGHGGASASCNNNISKERTTDDVIQFLLSR